MEKLKKSKKDQNNYHDGENVTHYLGNDDYDGSGLVDPNEVRDNRTLEGKEAQGNEQFQDDDEK